MSNTTDIPQEVEIALANMLHAQFELGALKGEYGNSAINRKTVMPVATAMKDLVEAIRTALHNALREGRGAA